ncbi:MAG: carboxypeptidase regulatory-like domain-containing protein [Isosphaeraceae bacterium]
MRIPRLTHCLLALVCTLAGCTQTAGFRSSAVGNSSPSSNIRTVASIGDKPIPIVTGEPGLSQRPETEEIDLPASTGARISGRVYDDRGRPVPNVKVRLAVGGSPSGKASYATTDRSGAFTLRGLRAGSYYTVIAEYQAQSGALSGRIEARAPDTNVRISLRSGDSDSDQAHATIRPAKSRLSASLEDDEDETAEVRTRTDRFNSEDLEPPAAEATSMLPGQRRNASRLSAGDSLPPIRAGWNPRQRPQDDGTGSQPRSNRTSAGPGSSNSRNSRIEPVDEDDDEGPNPLPPALDSKQVGSTFPGDSGDDPPLKIAAGRPRPSSRASRPMGPAARESDDPASSRGDERLPDREPRPMPDGIVPNTREMRPDSFAPIRGTAPADPDNRQSRSASRARRGAAAAPAQARASDSDSSDEPSAADSRPGDEAASRPADESASRAAPDAAPRRPTWRDLTLNLSDAPVDESVQLAANLTDDKAPQVVTPTGSTSPIRRTLFQRFGGSKPAIATAEVSQSVCRVDPTDRRLVDLRLPGLDGKIVSFKDMDADLVLLDFWGSWCKECRRSIPHLSELQAKYGKDRLRVVGVACERGSTLQERQASAAKAARGLKISYSVVVSSMDGSCPVQKGMQIQFYPTMVLIDRTGHILQREQGATDTTLARIDRAVANALK